MFPYIYKCTSKYCSYSYILNIYISILLALASTIITVCHCQRILSTVENDSVSELFSLIIVFSSSEDLMRNWIVFRLNEIEYHRILYNILRTLFYWKPRGIMLFRSSFCSLRSSLSDSRNSFDIKEFFLFLRTFSEFLKVI